MPSDQLTRTFAALADPTRRAILSSLREHGRASVAELAAPFELTPRAISKHIGVLEAAGLISRERDAQRRPSRLRVEPLIELDNWLDGYRAVWEHRFTALEADLNTANADLSTTNAEETRS
ncbi:helix-turn-helix transcriptional regulator [Leucobacter sp. CSA1]|uniref:Helix-turn-helix transcriptional regulator n=1 Tax=Leucobacter chromiisoli TaxID=2796471 RepID=A0A934QAY5_9MICO|nr:metalloregulator ArsR/SmtB family transcription factor [Leucobacter chromiisoli]MBK0419844.1 helix-turn-helix transcriptional regulator [Leucobacter chromiisoli]